jgi:hypothetical protein
MGVDRGRIVVREPSGAVEILRGDGSLARRFSFAAGAVKGVALDAADIVVLTPSRLEAYSAVTGTLRHSISLAASAAPTRRLEGVDDGLAALVEGTSIRVVRLEDGRATVIRPPHGSGPVDAHLQPPGLCYSYHDRASAEPGRLALLPRADLLARF